MTAQAIPISAYAMIRYCQVLPSIYYTLPIIYISIIYPCSIIHIIYIYISYNPLLTELTKNMDNITYDIYIYIYMDSPRLTIINIIIMYQDFSHGLTDWVAPIFRHLSSLVATHGLASSCSACSAAAFSFSSWALETSWSPRRNELVTPFMIYCRTI